MSLLIVLYPSVQDLAKSVTVKMEHVHLKQDTLNRVESRTDARHKFELTNNVMSTTADLVCDENISLLLSENWKTPVTFFCIENYVAFTAKSFTTFIGFKFYSPPF